ncbi:MAG: DUF4112 domain-containing protein [Acidobacteriota bacterium]
MDTRRRLESLRQLQHLLDNAFRVPGTNLRFGWDPVIGAVPWVGDVLAALMSCAIVVQAHHMRLPRAVQARMLLNTAIDVVVGSVPVVGDVADVFWKSNAKNFALLERHGAEVRPATVGDRLFVAGIVLAVLALALAPLVMMYLAFRLLWPR